MKFLKSMSERESLNWKKGAIIGFYTYTLITAVNYFYYLVTGSSLFSPTFTFWIGLLAAFIFELIFNLKYKSQSNTEDK